MPVTRRFIKDASKRSQSTTAFYEEVGRSGGTMIMAGEDYKLFQEAGRDDKVVEHLQNLDERHRVWALLQDQKFTADERRLHPLHRAREVVRVINQLRREMSVGDVVVREKEGRRKAVTLTIPTNQKRVLDDELSRLAMKEARNALIVTGNEGWAFKELMPTQPTFDVIKEVSPELAKVFKARLEKNKVMSADKVADLYPEIAAKLMDRGVKARLRGYVSRARRGQVFTSGRRRVRDVPPSPEMQVPVQ
jgi:hypothetical protein